MQSASEKKPEKKSMLVYVVLAQLGLLAAWQALAHSGAAGLTVPTPASVLRVYLQPRFAALLYRSALATISSAAAGFAAGALLGTATAMVSYVLPPLRPGLDRLAVTVNAIPAVVLGPIFILLVSRELTPALLAAISVFFLIYVAVASGLRTASAGLSAMMTTFGAGRWQRFVLPRSSFRRSFLAQRGEGFRHGCDDRRHRRGVVRSSHGIRHRDFEHHAEL